MDCVQEKTNASAVLSKNEIKKSECAAAVSPRNKRPMKSEFSRYNEVKPFNVFPEVVKVCVSHRGQVNLPAPGRVNFYFSKESNIDLALKNVKLKVSSVAPMKLCGEHECGLDGYIHAKFRTNTVISFDVAAPVSKLSWELNVPDRGPVKFRVAFQLDMVATANASRQKLEFSLPCDKLVAKFNALNVRLTKKVESKIPICLQQLNQQMQGQCQDLRSGFDHDIEHYTAMLQTNLHSTPPALPPPASEDPVRALPAIAQCRDELISARSLHVQCEELLQEMMSDQSSDRLSEELQSLLDKRQKMCKSVVKRNRLFISTAEKTLENYVGLLSSRSTGLRKIIENWRQDATKAAYTCF